MAWTGWVLMVMAIALSTTNPFYLAIVLLCVGLVAAVAPRTAAGFASFKALLLLGTGVCVMSVLIAVVNGNVGQQVLFTVPGPEVPRWLGGLQVGGPVTAEALVANGLRGMTILCIFLAFGVFSAVVSPHRLLRTAPAAVFHAGLVVTIGLTLLPSSLEDLRRIREMQALRGGGTGLRQLTGLVVPAVIGGLERSMRLAEAMEARGYAAAPSQGRGGQWAGAASPLLLLGAAYFWLTGGVVAAVALACGGFGTLGAWGWLAARGQKTTRYRVERMGAGERLAAGVSLGAGAVAVVGGSAGWFALAYNPFAGLPWPELAPAGAALALLCAWPAVWLVFGGSAPAAKDEHVDGPIRAEAVRW